VSKGPRHTCSGQGRVLWSTSASSVSWSHQGEVVYKGTVIPWPHQVTLVHKDTVIPWPHQVTLVHKDTVIPWSDQGTVIFKDAVIRWSHRAPGSRTADLEAGSGRLYLLHSHSPAPCSCVMSLYCVSCCVPFESMSVLFVLF